jgi:MFS family permease
LTSGRNDARQSSARLAAGAAIASVSIVGIGLSLTNTLLAVRLEQAGFPARAIGINTAASGLAALAAAPAVPVLAHRLGVRPALLATLITCALCLAAFAATNNYFAWLAIRIIYSAALTVLFVLSEFWINTAAPEERRGLVMGIYTASLSAGFAAGPLLLTLTGMEGILPFGASILLFSLAAAPISLVGSKAPKLDGHAKVPFLRFLLSAPVTTLAALVYGGIETAGLGLLPVYALRSGLDAKTGASLVSLFALGNVAFQIPIGYASDRFDRRRLLLAISGLGAAGAVLLPLLSPRSFASFCTLIFFWGGIVGGLYAVGLAYLGARYRGAELAGANAAYIMLYSIGMLTAPPLLGFGLDLTPGGLFFGIAAMLAVYFCIAFAQNRRAHS